MDHAVAFKAARGVQPFGGQHGIAVQQRTIGFEMQDIGRRLHLAQFVTPIADDAGQFGNAGGIGPGRTTDQNLGFGCQDIPTFDKTGALDGGNLAIKYCQMRGHFSGFAQTAGRAGAHDDSAFG